MDYSSPLRLGVATAALLDLCLNAFSNFSLISCRISRGGGDTLSNMSDTDLHLLARYTRGNAEDAFTELVRRHLDLVHSAALRQVRSPQLAEEVAQSVFTDLARQAHRLASDTILTAWLYEVTRRTAIDVVRREARRQLREQIATEMNAMNATTADWTNIEPLLDEAMHALDETDRAAVLLRYFENKSLREVGQSLGTSDDAAQKRVSRAVDRLREFLAKRGVSIGASGLAVAVSANAVQAAPVGLALTISAAATLAGTTVATTATVTKAIAMTTMQKTLITSTLAIAVGVGIYEASLASRNPLDGRHPTDMEVQQLERTLKAATNQVAALERENSRLRTDLEELFRLRNETSRLRADSQELARLKSEGNGDPFVAEAISWKERASLLQKYVESNPGTWIPELQFATEQDWLNATKQRLETEKDYRRAMSSLRNAMESKFAKMLQPALKKYMKANNDLFPTDLAQLLPYFESPINESLLRRYAILPKDDLSNIGMGGDWIISQRAAVDAEFDSRLGVGPNGWGSTGPHSWQDSYSKINAAIITLEPVMKAYGITSGGKEPADLSELLPYIVTPEQQKAYEMAMQHFNELKHAKGK